MVDMEQKKGYVIAICDDSDFYIDNALHIECNDSLIPLRYQDDEEAAKAAEKDGVKLVYGMEGVADGVYVDTPDNRRILEHALRENLQKPSIKKTMQHYQDKIDKAPKSEPGRDTRRDDR